MESLASRELGYLRKWVPIALLIGTISGVGSILFFEAIDLTRTFLLGGVTGFFAPSAIGEGGGLGLVAPMFYLIPIVTTVEDFAVVYSFTAWHLKPKDMELTRQLMLFITKRVNSSRIPLVKLVASALTIGSGGSAGREGPTAQIGARFGSFLGRRLHLSLHDRRIAVAIGIGSGIGSIFKAPFGGAIMSTEILYMGDFEVEALLPAFIASTVGYSIFALFAGGRPCLAT